MYLYFYLTYNNYKIFKCGIFSRKHIAIKGFLFYSLFNYMILYTLPCVLVINFCILYNKINIHSFIHTNQYSTGAYTTYWYPA